jgi:hypothetical protein
VCQPSAFDTTLCVNGTTNVSGSAIVGTISSTNRLNGVFVL